jgi:copper type II ascorbate-dependent monooxygenase-like protein
MPDPIRISPMLSALLSVSLFAPACGGVGQPPAEGPTYWQAAAPVLNAKCVKCHQADGLGPFPLDSYADAQLHAPRVAAMVKEGRMPPFLVTHDGSCGTFDDADALTPTERDTLISWAEGATREGTRVTLARPARRGLGAATDYRTPVITPVAQGGVFAQFDEYRCFLVEPALDKDVFIAGYDILPGTPALVHHVAVSVVDPARPGADGRTNGELMAELDQRDPDRPGWPCTEFAGTGVAINSLPTMWAPGQQPVLLPAGVGIPVKKTDKLVVQVHFNLADPRVVGQSDSTTVRLRYVDAVQRRAVAVLHDPFVDSLRHPPLQALPPGDPAAKFSWKSTFGDMGLAAVPTADLIAVMPHMHQRGVRYEMHIGSPGEDKACVTRVERWDFHWQRLYFLGGPPVRISPASEVDLTCQYDTSADTKPVLPGWGTRNEMCSAIMLVALPPGI